VHEYLRLAELEVVADLQREEVRLEVPFILEGTE